jgi:glycosyltransferase involved in cell wall biosynthesis
MSATRRLRIAQVAPPVERVPPAAYGGTERVVDELTRQLVERGHDVTLFASGDSDVPARLVPTVERALRPAGIESDAGAFFATTVKMVVEGAAEFDVIHSHLEWWSIPLARLVSVPTVATFHGRLDLPWADRLLRDAPEGMVAISRHQASTHPDVPWTIIHNGLTLDRAPFLDEPGDAFCFVGRIDAEKGITEAIDIALRAGRRLRIAAKVGNLARQRDYYESVFRPALQRAGRSIEYLGELQPKERDQLFAESYATLMPGAWPEPFGLVSIESLACGTPVLARRVGALPEIIREGVDGYFGDDALAMAFFADRLGTLDRREIRERVIERFSAARMADRYEELYVRMIDAAAREEGGRERVADAAEVEEALAVQLPSEVTEPSDAELPEEAETAPIKARSGAESALADEPVAEAPGISKESEAIALAAEAMIPPEEAPEPREVAEATGTVAAATESTVAEPEAISPEPEAIPAETAAIAAEPEAGPTGQAEPAEPEPVEAQAVEEEAVEAEAVEAQAIEPEGVEAEATEAENVEEAPEQVAAVAEARAADEEPPIVEEPQLVEAPAANQIEEPEAAEEPEPVAEEPEPVAAEEPEPVAAEEPEPVAPEEPEPIAAASSRDADRSRAREAVTASAGAATESEQAAVAVLEAAVVDVLVEEPEEAAESTPAPPATRRARPGTGAAATAGPATTAPLQRPPIAVGPGGSTQQTPPPARAAEPAGPTAATPGATKPGPGKPAPKRPSRSISIFTRSWSGGSGKAAGSRRHDRS